MNKSELFYEEESKTARPHKYSINYKDKNDSVYAIKFYSMQKQIDEKDKEIERLNNIINELEEYHIKSMKNLENTEDFKYVGTNHIKILYEEHKRTLDKLKELKESGNNE